MSLVSLNTTEESGAAVDICVLEIKETYEVIPSIVCSVGLSFGLLYCFFGYRCFKMVMFLSGFMLGSAAVLLLYHKEPLLESHLGTETKAGVCLGVSVLCGLMTMLLHTMGLFLTGLQLGWLVSLLVLVVLGQFYSLDPAWVPLSSALAASIVTAVFTLQWQKLFTIVSTAVLGATAIMLCVDYLLVSLMLPAQVYDLLRQVPPRPFCWFNWTIAAIFPTLSVLGVLVQWKLTANNVSHREDTLKKQQKHETTDGCVESGRPRLRHQRRPPLFKRYTGDALAPSYLRSLQERQAGTGSSTSSITHNVTEFDFERGSMVPLTSASSAFRI